MKFKSKPILKLMVVFLLFSISIATDKAPAKPADTKKPTDDKKTGEKKPNTPAPTSSSNYKPVKCNKDVVNILGIAGLQPLAESTDHGFPACPRVKHACCNAADADKFMTHWDNISQHRLKKVLPAQKNVYVQLMDNMNKAYSKAKVVYSKTISEPDSDCKILSRTILSLRVEKVVKLIKGSLDQCHDSLQRAYKGIYCSICDGSYHTLINVGAKEFGLSFQDCRELAVGCHRFLLYMHAHVPEVLNLLLDFTAQCDADGKFTRLKIADDVIFNRVDDVAKKLEEARDNRNSDDWAKFFTPICGEFKMGEMAEYFMPNIKKYNEYVIYMAKALSGELQAAVNAKKSPGTGDASGQAKAEQKPGGDGKKGGKAGTPAPPASPAPPKLARLLSEAGKAAAKPAASTTSSSAPAPAINIFEPFKVFNADPTKPLPIDDFKTVVKEPGIDIYFVTNRSLLSKDELNAAKKMTKVTKSDKAKTEGAKNKDGKAAGEKKDDKAKKTKTEKKKNRKLRKSRSNKRMRTTRKLKL